MSHLAVPRRHLAVRVALVGLAAAWFVACAAAPWAVPAAWRALASGWVRLSDLLAVLGILGVLGALFGLLAHHGGGRATVPLDGAGHLAWRVARAPRVFALGWLVVFLLSGWFAVQQLQALLAGVPHAGAWLGAALGACGAALLMAVAVAWALDFVVEEAGEPGVTAEPGPREPPADLEPWFWDHTAYRGQIRATVELPPRFRVPADRAEREAIVRRFPVLAAGLDRGDWKADTWRAAERLVAAVLEAHAVVLAGWPGSGRGRLVGEIAELCREDQRVRAILVTPDARLPAGPRFGVEPRRVRGGEGFDAESLPEVLVCDPEAFARHVARQLVRRQPPDLWSLGLVALLEVDRYGREAMLHVREALTRLRTVMLARGRDLAVAVTTAPYDNALALAEAVANRTDVERVDLVRPAGPQRLVQWEPPPELDRDREELAPAPLSAEAADLVVALAGAGAAGPLAARERAPRLALVDPGHLLAPEAWNALRDEVAARLPEGVAAPELAHLVGPALPAPAAPFDAALVLALRPDIGPTVEGARGLVRDGGLIFVLEGPGVDLDAAVDRFTGGEPSAGAPGLALPVAPAGLRRAGWWALLEDLPAEAVVPRSRIRDAYGDGAWARLRGELAREAGITDVFDEVFAWRDGAVGREEAVVRPRAWSAPTAPPVPWGAITLDRLPVRSDTASAAEVGPALAELDRFRLAWDWVVKGIVPAGDHSLQVVEVRGEGASREIAVRTPGRREAIRRGVLRPWREVEARLPDEAPRVRSRGRLGSAGAVVLREGVGEVRERLLGHWSSAADLNPDPRRVGPPTRLEPALERRFSTWMVTVDWEGPGLDDPERARAVAATLLGAWLLEVRDRFVGFDAEFDTAILAGETGPRWVIHRRYAAPDRAEIGGLLPDSGESLHALLAALHARLARCDCDDGCPRCCARLGDVPLALVEAGDVPAETPGERVSRRATLAWLREAFDLVALERGALPDLALLRRQVIGTEDAGFRDGILWRLVRDRQPVAAEDLAPAEWMEPDPDEPGLLGLYVERVGGDNLVRVRRPEEGDGARFTVLQVLVHEYTHNWHYRGRGFDRDAWLRSEAARAWFEGKLVIEGHATWVETLYLLRRGRRPLYRADDLYRWSAYKAGYLLVDWIARTYGVGGLYRFLAGPEAMADGPPPARGRHGRAPWPLDLPTAIRLADLEGFIGAEAPAPSDALDPAGEGSSPGA